MVIGLVFAVIFFYLGATMDYSTKFVDCYDRGNNKIIGETCLDEYQFGDDYAPFILGTFSFILSIGLGLWFNSLERSSERLWREIK